MVIPGFEPVKNPGLEEQALGIERDERAERILSQEVLDVDNGVKKDMICLSNVFFGKEACYAHL